MFDRAKEFDTLADSLCLDVATILRIVECNRKINLSFHKVFFGVHSPSKPSSQGQ